MAISDELLLERWQNREDPRAFREIVQRHGSAVYGACVRILGNHADAADVTQECFLEVLRKRGASPPRRLGAWLHGMATNRSLMHLRSDKRRKAREAVYAEEQAGVTGPNENEMAQLLDEAMEDLPDELREPVVAHYLYGRSHGAIGRDLGIPRRTVGNRIQRGLAQMGAFLRTRGVTASAAVVATALASAKASAAALPVAVSESLAKLCLQEAALTAGGAAAGVGATGVAGLFAGKSLLAGVAILAVVMAGSAWWAVRDDAEPAVAVPETKVAAPPVEAEPDLAAADSQPEDIPSAAAAADTQGTLVSGIARFEDSGEPASGVLVRAYNEATDGSTKATTDTEGRYTLRDINPPERGVDLRVWALANREGWHAVVTAPPFRLFPGKQHTGVDITLIRNRGAISGTVQSKDAEYHPEKIRSVLRMSDGQSMKGWELLFGERVAPAAGVTVVLETKGLRKETPTDEEGRYQFCDLAPGQYEVYVVSPPKAVRVRKETRQEVRLAEAEAKAGVDFTYSVDTVDCKGRVINASGEPLAGARVIATPLDVVPLSGDDGFDRIRSAAVETVTDEEGLYELQGLMPAGFREVQGYLAGSTHLPGYGSTYTVRAAADGYASVAIVVPALQTELVEFCTGIFREAQGLPIPQKQKPTVAPGVILPVAPGNTLEGVDFVLYPEARISGTVLDTRGRTLADVKVKIVPPEEEKGDPPAFLAKPFLPEPVNTDEQGGFYLGSVPAGTYVFEAGAEAGFQRARNAAIAVRPGDIVEHVQVVVESAADRGRIEGFVTEAGTGQPVNRFELWIQKVDSPNEPSPRQGNLKKDSDTGAFTIDGISPGRITFDVKAEGFATQRIEAQVESSRTAELQIPLAREGILRGRVTRNGQPSGSGYVMFPGWEGAPYGGTDKDGYYEVKALPAGQFLVQYNMWLYEDGRGGAQAVCFRTAEIRAGHDTELDVQYDGTGVVHGAFSGPPGETWRDRNWRVELRDPNAPEESSLRAGTWKFETNGRYEIPDVPAGTYRVVAYCNGPDGTPVEQSQTITLSDGGTAEADFAF